MGGILDKISHGLQGAEDAVHGVVQAAEAAKPGLSHAAAQAFHGVMDGAKTVQLGVVHAAANEAEGMRQGAHAMVDHLRRGDAAGGVAEAIGAEAKGHGKAGEDLWRAGSSAVETAYHAGVGAARSAGGGVHRGYDAGVDGVARAVGDVAGPRAGKSVREAAQAVAAPVRDLTDMQFGITQGVAEGAGSLVHGLGDLVVGGVRVGTDAEVRDKLIAHVGQTATALGHVAREAALHPDQARRLAGHAAQGLVQRVVKGEQAASKRGDLPEWVGHGVGRGGFEVASALIPGAKAGEAARLAGKLGDGAEALADADRATKVAGALGAEGAAPAAVRAMSAEDHAAAGAAEGGAAAGAGAARRVAGTAPGATTRHKPPFDWVNDLGGKAAQTRQSLERSLECAEAVDKRLATGDVVPVQRSLNTVVAPNQLGGLDKAFGAPFRAMSAREIDTAMFRAGDGARGVVLGTTAGGHDAQAWNVVVHDGRLLALDGHTNMLGYHLAQDFPQLRLAITGRMGDGKVGAGVGALNRAVRAAKVPAGMGIARRLAAADRMTVSWGPQVGEAERVAAVKHIAKTLPAEMLERLRQAGAKVVVVGESPTDYLTHLKGVPSPYGSGTFDDSLAIYDGGTRELVMSTREVPGGAGIAPRRLIDSYDGFVDGTLLHEAGHAVDHLYSPDPTTGWLSGQPAFAGAMSADSAMLRRATRTDPGNPRETFAETFRAFVRHPVELRENAPHAYAYFKELTAGRGGAVSQADVAARMKTLTPVEDATARRAELKEVVTKNVARRKADAGAKAEAEGKSKAELKADREIEREAQIRKIAAERGVTREDLDGFENELGLD